MHWTKRRKDKEEWAWEIGLALTLISSSSKPQRLNRPVRVKVNVHQVRSRLLDRDNLWASCKNVVDAIVLCGLARDDSEKWMDLSVTQEVGKDHRTEITVE